MNKATDIEINHFISIPFSIFGILFKCNYSLLFYGCVTKHAKLVFIEG